MPIEVDVNQNARGNLVQVLDRERHLLTELLRRAHDDHASPAEFAHLADLLDAEHERRNFFIRELREQAREEAARERPREDDRSVRKFVLAALQEIGSPAKAGFVTEYVWAVERVDLNTRGFGRLRKDEQDAWEDHHGLRPDGKDRSVRRPPRPAYVVPGLNARGQKLPRYMVRSDWPAEQRVVLVPYDRLVELAKLSALFRARQQEGRDYPFAALGFLIEKHAGQVLEDFDAPPPGTGALRERWFEQIRRQVETEIKKAAKETQEERRAAAKRIEGRSERDRILGLASRTHT
jgi:hypothetical protein